VAYLSWGILENGEISGLVVDRPRTFYKQADLLFSSLSTRVLHTLLSSIRNLLKLTSVL
jgi:hypothetical protein